MLIKWFKRKKEKKREKGRKGGRERREGKEKNIDRRQKVNQIIEFLQERDLWLLMGSFRKFRFKLKCSNKNFFKGIQ